LTTFELILEKRTKKAAAISPESPPSSPVKDQGSPNDPAMTKPSPEEVMPRHLPIIGSGMITRLNSVGGVESNVV
jgi:hypothetical protein